MSPPRAKKPKLSPSLEKRKNVPNETGGLALTSEAANQSKGHLFTFGNGDTGQLGLGEDVTRRKYPALVDLKHNKVVQVACGGMHTVVLDENGCVWTFGVNDDKALGRPASDEDSFTPGKVELPKRIVQITAGDAHSAVLSDDGQVYGWGAFKDLNGNFGLVPNVDDKCIGTPTLLSGQIKTKIKKIASGDNHLVMLSSDGRVFTCGTGEQGQLGRLQRRKTRSTNEAEISERDSLLTPTEVKMNRKKFVDIWAGAFATFCLSSRNNEIWVFGLNNHDQLGLRNTDVVNIPTKSLSFKGEPWTQIAAGQHHTIALNSQGKVFALGRTNDGRTGLGEDIPETISRPTLVPTLSSETCIEVAAGLSTSYAINSQGSLFAWGFGGNYQLGTGQEDDLTEPRKLLHIVKDKTKYEFEGTTLKVSGGGQHVAIILDQDNNN